MAGDKITPVQWVMLSLMPCHVGLFFQRGLSKFRDRCQAADGLVRIGAAQRIKDQYHRTERGDMLMAKIPQKDRANQWAEEKCNCAEWFRSRPDATIGMGRARFPLLSYAEVRACRIQGASRRWEARRNAAILLEGYRQGIR